MNPPIGEFRTELTNLLNKHNKEVDSNTPDFILADYLINCLEAFERATNLRSNWYGRKDEPGGTAATLRDKQLREVRDTSAIISNDPE